MKPSTSLKGVVQRKQIKGILSKNFLANRTLENYNNKYYTLIDEAMRLTTGLRTAKRPQNFQFTTSKLGSSDKEMTKSASENFKTSTYLKTSSTTSKLRNQFHNKIQPKNKNAKELLLNRNTKSRQTMRAGRKNLGLINVNSKGRRPTEL